MENERFWGFVSKMRMHLRRVRTHEFFERVEEAYRGCLRFLEGCICSIGLVLALGLWFEFELIPNILSGSILKVFFYRQK